jgi:hypothetical protein
MPRPPDERGPAGTSRRAPIANPLTRLDNPNDTLPARDPQRRVALIIGRKFSLRLGVALVVAGSIGAGGVP